MSSSRPVSLPSFLSLRSARSLSLFPRQRKWEIIFPAQTNGPCLREAGLKLDWTVKNRAHLHLNPSDLQKHRSPSQKQDNYCQLPVSISPSRFHFWAVHAYKKRKCLNDSVICDNYRWSTEAKRLSPTLKWFHLFISEWKQQRGLARRRLTASARGSRRQSLERFLKLLTSVWRLARGLRASRLERVDIARCFCQSLRSLLQLAGFRNQTRRIRLLISNAALFNHALRHAALCRHIYLFPLSNNWQRWRRIFGTFIPGEEGDVGNPEETFNSRSHIFEM